MFVESIFHLPSWMWTEVVEKPVESPRAERVVPQEKVSRYIPRPGPPTARPLRNVTKETQSPKVLHALIRSGHQTPEELEWKLYNTPEVNKEGIELKTPHFYASFFNHGFKGSVYFAVAHLAFQEAVRNGRINNVVCNQFINVAGKTLHFKEAKEAFNIANERGCLDQWTINSFIYIAGINNQWDDAGGAFALGCQRGLCDNITGNTLIENAGKSKNFGLAQRIFNWMLEVPGLADAFTFSIFIKSAGICGRFDECQRAYQIAKERARSNPRVLNSYIFNNFIYAAFKNNDFPAARAAFGEAKKLGHADEHVIQTYNHTTISNPKRGSKR